MKVKPSKIFVRDAARLFRISPKLKDCVEGAVRDLETNPFSSHLKSHKLKGPFRGLWSAKAGYDLRIVFEFVREEGENVIVLHTIGTHDEVY